jgi:hypothetical protein
MIEVLKIDGVYRQYEHYIVSALGFLVFSVIIWWYV